jgi:NAD(P)-dependent dehydrogenase (short-subunit alcohol dehydrogenase family)
MKIKDSIALVTGASSGIGQASAERLAKAGYKVYGTSRRGAQAGQRSFAMLPLDVTTDESVEAAVKELIRLEGRIDLLVNNAGFGVAPAGAEESSMEQAKAIFETNFFGLVRMTRAVVPHMRRQGSGRIINIGSVLGFLPMPYGALYAATKHAVEGYSESLDHELRTRGIRVSVIEPAYTKTQFDANFLAPDSKLDEYREVRTLLDRVLKEQQPSPTTQNSATRPAGSRIACGCCADLRRLHWWMRAFERICGSTHRRRCCPAPRPSRSSGSGERYDRFDQAILGRV